MFDGSGMMSTNYIIEKSMNVESLRRKVIADNVANVDVPHFKRSEVNFESELKRALYQNKDVNENRLPAILTDDRHIPFFTERDIKSVSPRINVDYTTSMRNDGNNVDIEKEMVDSSKNIMRYNALVSALNHNYKMLKTVVRTV
ncbi:MAG TPA: flagellar basal body rod protein FlgB [Spirochaetota bacterium]|nr:flagellar basal body rod protein FlgB [Spirochaetota bacterium]HPF04600.1 flagellar basal body rod protein FlgB [Spirochaetota bacterium]HPJ42008.1 flagellar basal body rod protein FlgB [Spirochaetota bacterium]HPR36199.1 flagellar basal body rod protein FlgB [Spirochaetota bacterium]HRX46122.1 flagellar basal body rod protein FlgB [Spirochaetota bacterium]